MDPPRRSLLVAAGVAGRAVTADRVPSSCSLRCRDASDAVRVSWFFEQNVEPNATTSEEQTTGQAATATRFESNQQSDHRALHNALHGTALHSRWAIGAAEERKSQKKQFQRIVENHSQPDVSTSV